MTSLRHTNLDLTEYQRALLARLDGEQTRAQLAAWTLGLLESGSVEVTSQLAPTDLAPELVDAALADLATMALLIDG